MGFDRLCDQARDPARQAAAPSSAGTRRRSAGRCRSRRRARHPNSSGGSPGEGAFYAPKLEFHLKDAIGRSWQVGTLQLDYVLPERLDATYVAEDGAKYRPVMLHRAILGSLERFIGMMIEHYAGRCRSGSRRCRWWSRPSSPTPTTMPRRSLAKLKAAGIRAEPDLRNEKINYKVREHSLAKVPLLFVVGKREAEEGTVSVRRLGSDDHQKMMGLDDAVAMISRRGIAPDLALD